jgi:hypothetical protein
MQSYTDNRDNYRPSIVESTRQDMLYTPFTATVISVDWEGKVLTIQTDKDRLTYSSIRVWPANASTAESTDVNMPEQGSRCIAVLLYHSSGFSEVAIIAWITTSTIPAIDAVANRWTEGIDGLTSRRRGTYRKAFPGQKAMTTTSGYSEKVDEGWDTSASDFSRDKLDVFSRTRTLTTSRNVGYADSGLSFAGPVNRPPQSSSLKSSSPITPTTLPDGTQSWVLFLNPTAAYQSRYLQGTANVIPLTEKVEKIQEFALDYPMPQDVLETPLIDFILGTTQPVNQQTTINEEGTQLPNGSTTNVAYDSDSFMVDQAWDNPLSRTAPALGPTTQEGPTPARRGFIIEKAEGTLVGSNRFDALTFAHPLIPILTPYTYLGRFGANFESGYLPINMSNEGADHVQTRMAASCLSVRFPYEYNTTRWDVTKEGMFLFEIGSSIPQANNPWQGAGDVPYEYPHGAGRSVEGHLVGSLKLVIGKNMSEEDAMDLQALGQCVLRFGADDCSLPYGGREVLTQNRGKSDAFTARNGAPGTLQYWNKSALGQVGNQSGTGTLTPSLTNKTYGENISIRGASDGGVVFRFGARTPDTLRAHLINGYADGPGVNYQPVSSYNATSNPRIDSHSPGRQTYGFGDSNYAFPNHNLMNAGQPITNRWPYSTINPGPTVNSMDRQGLSIDFHTVRDILIRAGKDTDHGQSLLMDLAGGLVAWIGADKQGRSMTFTMDGGISGVLGATTTIGASGSTPGKALRLEINGDVDLTVNGNYQMNVTGDYLVEANSVSVNSHTDMIHTCQKMINMALARITNEALDIVHSQGGIPASNANDIISDDLSSDIVA